ncbi:DUF2846 domain-containing protein [Aeromonas salmonicida]|jgi:hypothetical protein|uniref:DUF2846 domain-containing protein n=1 Tax=Aeromonas salmonicida TaxID=645 RepID=UPI00259D594B|nr:DUF2846 domain-containing protein [Aeromonas salmonicida]MDM5115441.1 DUF2846 domain-containing protein [Aeromonas salmonicida]
MMFKKLALVSSVLGALLLAGCASVPMENAQENAKLKAFPVPENNMAGLYIYRDSFVGKALKKDVYVDSACLGETADRTFLYKQVAGGKKHDISTESEFSDNKLSIIPESGKNYFFRQYIKMGVFVGGANLEAVSESEGKRVVSKESVQLAKSGICSS